MNGGIPYLQSPKAVTDKYGIIERVWVDRRYEDQESLKAAAQVMLDELQEPQFSYQVGFQELHQSDYDRAAVGKRVRILFTETGETVDTYITEVERTYDEISQSTFIVANREASIASSLADMADRQRIEQTYAQGATQLYAQALQANCDSKNGAVMDFFIPREMRIVNQVLAKVRMGQFRAYSQSTQTQASQAATTSSTDSQAWTSSGGGGGTTTSNYGGGSIDTSEGGGGIVTDTGDSGINVHWIIANTQEAEGHSHGFSRVDSHQHRITLPDHTHQVTVPNHTHQVTSPSHTHSVTIPGHSHTVTIPGHSHQITPGIYKFGRPKSFSLWINGVKQADFSGSTAELDITSFLVGSDKTIPRGSWLSIEIRPDDLAYISIDLIIQGFVQSRGDKTV